MPTRYLLTATLALALGSFAQAEMGSWTNLDGQAMKAEFLGRKGDYVSFKREDGSRYLYPYAKLSETDRARVDSLVRSNPALAQNASEPQTSAPTPAAPAARLGSVSSALTGKLVLPKGGSLAPAPRDHLNGVKHLAFYYSAQWCPPCRAFTPELVEAYNQIKAKHPDFELIFVTSDRDAQAMTKYITDYNMPWPSVRFGDHRSLGVLKRPDHERGIPNLVFMDADGKELSVSYTPDGNYRGPRNVLRDIKKHYKL